MFSSTTTSRLAHRLLGALGLIRSFLLLEDDYIRDWEVDGDERGIDGDERFMGRLSCRGAAWEEPSHDDHPHRVRLRGRMASRRPGEPAPHEHVCLCPVESSARVRPARDAARREAQRPTAAHE